MSGFFDFIDLIKEELTSLLNVLPPYVSVTIGVALSFVIILGVMRIWALALDDVPFL